MNFKWFSLHSIFRIILIISAMTEQWRFLDCSFGMCACVHFKHVGRLVRAIERSCFSLCKLSDVISATRGWTLQLQHGRHGYETAACRLPLM